MNLVVGFEKKGAQVAPKTVGEPAWNPILCSKSAIRMTDTRYYVDSSIVGARSLLKLRGMIDTTRMKETSFLIILTGIGQYAYCREDEVLVVSV